MGDIVKTVKVDNWGTFFLQKLQNFFNRTDYCDLTIQFLDSSQLKVHRLVLSACTDYFNMLEIRANCMDDILIMPREMQADVVVPIVNFMYTGSLEFEVRMYDKLLRTAKEMKMTVLLKLLEAHRKSIPLTQPQPPQRQPILLNKGVMGGTRPLMRGGGVGSAGRGRFILSGNRNITADSAALVSRLTQGGGGNARSGAGPSRYETARHTIVESFDPRHTTVNAFDQASFTDISYESKPLLTQADEDATFEKLRRSGNVNPNKRPADAVDPSPPAKKLNLQDVKEYTEAARLRNKLARDEGDDDTAGGVDYEVDDTYSGSSGDEQTPRKSTSLSNPAVPLAASTKKTPESTATVVLHERGNQKMDHAKILQEVLKKYPNLAKTNKNIKLKIVQKRSGGSIGTGAGQMSTGITVTVAAHEPATKTASAATSTQQQHRVVTRQTPPAKTTTSAAPSISRTQQLPTVASVRKEVASEAPQQASLLKKPVHGNRIDSKTMHALIAMGAENTEGPWLCLRCGVDGKPIGIPSYRSFRKHLINVHHERIEPRLCEHCGYKSSRRLDLYYHIQTKHDIKPPQDVVFPVCDQCDHVAIDRAALASHKETQGHGRPSRPADVSNCPHCDRRFPSRKSLTMHMNMKHRDKLHTDVDSEYVEDVYVPSAAVVPVAKQSAAAATAAAGLSKVKILSDVSLSGNSHAIGKRITRSMPPPPATSGSSSSSRKKTDTAVAFHEDLSKTQYIEAALASVHGEYVKEEMEEEEEEAHVAEEEVVTKFVAEDGSELELTPQQKEQLMSQLRAQEAAGGSGDNVMMVLNDDAFGAPITMPAIGSTVAAVTEVDTGEVITDDDNNILMVYNTSTQQQQKRSRENEAREKLIKEEEEDAEDHEDHEMGDVEVCGPVAKAVAAAESELEQMKLELAMLPQEHDEDNEVSMDDVEMSAAAHSTEEEEEEGDAKSGSEVVVSAKAATSDDTRTATQGKSDTKKDPEGESEKMKLIKELEGDWTEEGDMKEEEEEEEVVADEDQEQKEEHKNGKKAPPKENITEAIINDWDKEEDEEEEVEAVKEVVIENADKGSGDLKATEAKEVKKEEEEAQVTTEDEKNSITKESTEAADAGTTAKKTRPEIAAFMTEWEDDEDEDV